MPAYFFNLKSITQLFAVDEDVTILHNLIFH